MKTAVLHRSSAACPVRVKVTANVTGDTALPQQVQPRVHPRSYEKEELLTNTVSRLFFKMSSKIRHLHSDYT